MVASVRRGLVQEALLPGWFDVDTAQELERLRAALAAQANADAPRTHAYLRRLESQWVNTR